MADIWNQGIAQQTPAVLALYQTLRGSKGRSTKKRARASGAKRSRKKSAKAKSKGRKGKKKAARFVKGSLAAKRYMAKLRKMAKRK